MTATTTPTTTPARGRADDWQTHGIELPYRAIMGRRCRVTGHKVVETAAISVSRRPD